MTELDLFHQYIPDIAEMIIDQRERTQEQRVQWYKDCVEYAKSLNPFVYDFIRKTFMVIDNYLEENDDTKMMKIKDCLHCNKCMSHCPYGLNTPELLARNLKDYEEVLAGKVMTATNF